MRTGAFKKIGETFTGYWMMIENAPNKMKRG